MLLVAEIGQDETLEGAGRPVLAVDEVRQPALELGRPPGLAHPLGRGESPAPRPDTRRVTALEFGERLGVPSLLFEGMSKIAVSLGVFRLEAEPPGIR